MLKIDALRVFGWCYVVGDDAIRQKWNEQQQWILQVWSVVGVIVGESGGQRRWWLRSEKVGVMEEGYIFKFVFLIFFII